MSRSDLLLSFQGLLLQLNVRVDEVSGRRLHFDFLWLARNVLRQELFHVFVALLGLLSNDARPSRRLS